MNKVNSHNLTGIINIGNTCYMNASLQLLIQCNILTKCILNNKFRHHLLDTYKSFLYDYFNNKSSPIKLKQIINNKFKKFNNSGQHDSHEFILDLLNYFDEAIIEESNYLGKVMNCTNIVAHNIQLNKFISSLFDVRITSSIKCSGCNSVSHSTVGEKILSIEINGLHTYEECLKHFFDKEIIDDYYCSICYENTKAIKKISITCLPKYLIIHLKRFNNELQKLSNEIIIPECIIIKNYTYMLRSFIYNSGGLDGGHYINFTKSENVWYCINDNGISIANINDYLPYGYIYLFVLKINRD